MNEHHEFAVWATAIAFVLITFIISVTTYNMHVATLEAQAVPQVVIEGETL